MQPPALTPGPMPEDPPPPPATVTDLHLALALDEIPGPQVAGWRDLYVGQGDSHLSLVEMCVEELHERQLCYSCGQPADQLVRDEFPWVCTVCAGRA